MFPTTSAPRATGAQATTRLVAIASTVALLIAFSATRAMAADVGEDSETPKPAQPYSLQAVDPDRPQTPAEVAAKKAAAEAALHKEDKPVDTGPPLYTNWKFWAVSGAVVVGVVGAIVGSVYVIHSMNGGDVAGCPMSYARCFGQGR
jgi:hypothetical protein